MPPNLVSLSLELAEGVAVTQLPPSIEELWYRGSAPLPSPLPSSLRVLHCDRNDLAEMPPIPVGASEPFDRLHRPLRWMDQTRNGFARGAYASIDCLRWRSEETGGSESAYRAQSGPRMAVNKT